MRKRLVTVVLLAVSFSGAASAEVLIRLPREARFAAGQRFDIRVEAIAAAGGAPAARIDLTVDGRKVPLPAPDASGGATARAVTLAKAGPHAVEAAAFDGRGASLGTARTTVTVIDPRGNGRKAKNVIILLGDGMGAAHRTAARIVSRGYAEGRAQGRLAMDTFPGTALVMTSSLNAIVTDSAPGMSSYASGSKSANNQEGVFPDNTAPARDDGTRAFDNPRVEYLGAYLHRTQGKALGIVTTADVEDATPAAMLAHTSNRNAGTGIVDQFLDEGEGSGLAVLMGGGRRWFLPAGTPGSSRSRATDYELPAGTLRAWDAPDGKLDPQRDLLAEFRARGFAYASSRAELADPKIVPAKTKKLLGLFALGNMNASLDKIAKRRNPDKPGVVDLFHAPDQPLLDEMARAALDVLSRSPQGFVLLIEGAHIDKQSHAMDAERAVWETIEFDRAVAVAKEFADKAGDTLVIVTADHECGGFSLIGGSTKPTAELRTLPADQKLKAVGLHEESGFPTYPLAADGYPQIVDPDGKLLVGYGAGNERYEDWLAEENPVIESLNPDDLRAELKAAGLPPTPIDRHPDREQGMYYPAQAPYGGGMAAHTATDIPLSAYSTGSEAWRAFSGVLDNTDVFFKLAAAAAGGL
jgi:alkaline phosphatase